MGDLENELADALRREIDREIIAEITTARFTAMGWTLIMTPNLSIDTEGMGLWMQENIKGDWRGLVGRWLFQMEEDAVLFKLRWV